MTAQAHRDEHRRAMTAKVHIAKKDLALSDDTYRQVLHRVTGNRSAADCSHSELALVLEEFKRLGWKPKRSRKRAGPRPQANSPQAGKARALWMALYHLGEIDNPSEAALAGFARRVTQTEALQWLDAEQLSKVIEGLKDRCARAGFAPPSVERVKEINAARRLAKRSVQGAGFAAKCGLIEALWKALAEADAFRHGSDARLDTWLAKGWSVSAPHFLGPLEADQAIEQLGAWLRRVKAVES